jgi:hypothetical protein
MILKWLPHTVVNDGDLVRFQLYGRNQSYDRPLERLHVSVTISKLNDSDAQLTAEYSGPNVSRKRIVSATVSANIGDIKSIEFASNQKTILRYADEQKRVHDQVLSIGSSARPQEFDIPVIYPAEETDDFTITLYCIVRLEPSS